MTHEADDMLVEFDSEQLPQALRRTGGSARLSWALAWGSSILIHVGLVAVGLLLLDLHFRTPPRIELNWGEAGSGAAGEMVVSGQDDGTSVDAPAIPAARKEILEVPAAPALQRPAAAMDAKAIDDALVNQREVAALAGAGAQEPDVSAVIGVGTDSSLPFYSSASSGPGPKFSFSLPTLASAAGDEAAGGSEPLPDRPPSEGGSGLRPKGGAGGSGASGGSGAAGGGFRSIPQPIYPRECRLRGEQGTVVLEIEIRADGSVGQVRVVDDAGHPLLAAAAVAAVRQASVTPAYEDGKPISVSIRQPFNFVLR